MSIVTSVLTGGANSHTTTSEEVNAWATDFVSEGIVSTISNTSGVAPATGGFAVNATGTPNANVQISAGIAYVQGTPTSQNAQTFRVKNSATAALAISANSSGGTKYDWIYIKLDATKLNAPDLAGDDAATLVASRSSSSSADDGTPPTYGYPIAVVTVANGFSTITNGNIRDVRTQTTPAAPATSSSAGWNSLGATPSSVAANGNRSYTLTFTGTDLTTSVSNGMRLRTTRTTAAPTQCTSLNGTTQYYSKTSPAGMTFTDDFVVSAWIKVSSYASASIASRYNGTSGWNLQMNADGRIQLEGYNAASANFSLITSQQSVPLNKWVHVASQLDMSTFTATTTTSYVMINGVDVPASVARAGTNPTALVQAGNLEIGSRNGGLQPFPGKIAQVAIYSAKVTQATVLAAMHQTLAGTETSLVSAYSFNNTLNDLNANANNLTANNSAVATNADSPFGGQADGTISSTLDYAIITNAAFSSNTTLTVQVPEGCTIPTSGGITAVSYTTAKTPYGMPVQKDKWQYMVILLASLQTASVSSGTTVNLGSLTTQLVTLPIGVWYGTLQGILALTGSTTADKDAYIGLSQVSATLPTISTQENRLMLYHLGSGTTAIRLSAAKSNVAFNAASQTQYYLVGQGNGAGTLTNLGFQEANSNIVAGQILFDLAYL